MRIHQEVTYTLDLGSARGGRRQDAASPGHPDGDDAVPRIARLMALAIRCERLVRDQTVRDYAELARRGWVTRARMSQIIKLLDLAPDIQEEILFLARHDLNERNLRPVVRQIDWHEQRRMFQNLTNRLHGRHSA